MNIEEHGLGTMHSYLHRFGTIVVLWSMASLSINATSSGFCTARARNCPAAALWAKACRGGNGECNEETTIRSVDYCWK